MRRGWLAPSWLGLEYGLVFFGLVGAYTLLGSPGSPIPLLFYHGAIRLQSG
jgi:hypothetical protein